MATIKHLITKIKADTSYIILCLLIATDLLFIVIHILHTNTGYFAVDPDYSLYKDRGYSEIFQYIKEYWIILIFFGLSISKSEKSYLVWSMLFGYLLLDDSFRQHEIWGRRIADYFNITPMLGLRSVDFGELIVSGLVMTFYLVMLGTAYYFGSEEFKRNSKRIVVALILLVFFGIVVDMVHIIVAYSPFFSELTGVIEDGGEMVVMSGICWYVLRLFIEEKFLSSGVELSKLSSEPHE